jgi:hypothetical protein
MYLTKPIVGQVIRQGVFLFKKILLVWVLAYDYLKWLVMTIVF